MIRMPLRPSQQAIGVVVGHDLLFFAVPDELAAEDIGEIAEVAQRGGAVGNFDVNGGPRAALDGPEPVGLVVEVEVPVSK
jgi:hypothetical protein